MIENDWKVQRLSRKFLLLFKNFDKKLFKLFIELIAALDEWHVAGARIHRDARSGDVAGEFANPRWCRGTP